MKNYNLSWLWEVGEIGLESTESVGSSLSHICNAFFEIIKINELFTKIINYDTLITNFICPHSKKTLN